MCVFAVLCVCMCVRADVGKFYFIGNKWRNAVTMKTTAGTPMTTTTTTMSNKIPNKMENE